MRLIITITRLLLLFIQLLAVTSAFAQFYPVRRYTVEDGIPHSNVFRIFQDKKGFIWLGTEYGVSRFDGKKFNNYTSSEGLSFNTVMSVSEGPKEEKWVCTYGGGINIINNDSVKPFEFKSNTFSKSVIYSLFDNNRVWIIDKTGWLYCYAGEEMKHISAVDGDNTPVYFRRMIRLYNGEIIFSANDGIYKGKDGKITRFLAALVNERVYAVQQDKDGALWCALKNKVIAIKNGVIIKNIFIGDFTEISDMLVDKTGHIWLAVPGVGILHISSEGIKNITSYLKFQNILVNDLFEDRAGNIWIATHGSGLYFIQSLNIINYPVEQEKINNYTKTIKTIHGKIYCGSMGTISVCENEKFMSYPVSNLASADFIYFIEEWNNELYIGTPWGLIIKQLTGLKKAKMIPMPGAISYYRDSTGKKWVGCYGALGYIENGTFKRIIHPLFLQRRVNDIKPVANGDILFATDSGIIAYNGKTFTHLNISNNDWSNNINYILVDHRGELWLATDWGACRLKNGEKSWYYKSNGLSHNKCNIVAEDTKGNIWIGTMGGLDKFNDNYFRTFNHKSGLTSNEVLSLNFEADGSLWVGTVNGVSKILKGEAESIITVPDVYITSVNTKSGKYSFPAEITLNPGEKELRINFTAINFSNNDKTEFSYLISGQDDTWHTTTDNSLIISSLAPGNYTLLVKAGLPGAPGGENPTALRVRVLAPFWQKAGFILLSSITGIILFYLLIRWFIVRREKIKYKKASLHYKIAHLKQQALTALINPHFIFNCLNSIQAYIYKNNTQLANQYLIKFSRLIRMTLDRAEHTYISLEEEITRLELYLELERLRFGEKLKYTIECAPEIVPEQLKIPNMILQPYIENAIRHGIRLRPVGGNINLSFSYTGEQLLQIIVDDDGVGISKSMDKGMVPPHSPLGMKITGERLSLLSELSKKNFEVSIIEKTDDHGNVTGTRVTIMVATDAITDPVPLPAN